MEQKGISMVWKKGMSGGGSMGRLTFEFWVWKPTAVDVLTYHIQHIIWYNTYIHICIYREGVTLYWGIDFLRYHWLYHIKCHDRDMCYHFSNYWSVYFIGPQSLAVIAVDLSYPSKLDGKTLDLKTPYIWVI